MFPKTNNNNSIISNINNINENLLQYASDNEDYHENESNIDNENEEYLSNFSNDNENDMKYDSQSEITYDSVSKIITTGYGESTVPLRKAAQQWEHENDILSHFKQQQQFPPLNKQVFKDLQQVNAILINYNNKQCTENYIYNILENKHNINNAKYLVQRGFELEWWNFNTINYSTSFQMTCRGLSIIHDTNW